MNATKLRSRRAVTLTELLVVLAIISLLATIAVPVYLSQIQRARLATAQAETREISEAIQQAAIIHGFIVPIHVLDNVPNEVGNTGGSNRDDFDAMSGDTNYLIDIYRLLDDQSGSDQPKFGDSSTNVRVKNLIDKWQGPFLNAKRVRYVGDNNGSSLGTYYQDLVVDPWGRPYRLYTDLGLVGSSGLPSSTNPDADLTLGMDDGRISSVEVNRFDRFAVLSYGPDGISGFTTSNVLEQGDDIYYEFNALNGNESNYSPF